MSKKIYPVTDHLSAIKQLIDDVGSGNVKTYDVDNYKSLLPLERQPDALTDKWSHVTVAISGSGETDWLAAISYRIDEENGQKVYDRDTFTLAVEAGTNQPALTGLLTCHQDYETRTTEISGYDCLSKEETVGKLRDSLVTGSQPLSSASYDVIQTLHHSVKKFKQYFKDDSSYYTPENDL
jgi:hypothetical protein